MIATQLTLSTEPPPTATWDWTPRRDHVKRSFRHTHCRECRGDVVALITPHLWLVGECGHRWKVEV